MLLLSAMLSTASALTPWTGTCPGEVQFTDPVLDESGFVLLVAGTPGDFVFSSGPCAGTEMSVAPPAMARLFYHSAPRLEVYLPIEACGIPLQVVTADCLTSDVRVMPKDGCLPENWCPPDADPCILDRALRFDSWADCEIDLGPRDVITAPGARIEGGGFTATAGSFQLGPELTWTDDNGGVEDWNRAGPVTLSATGDIIFEPTLGNRSTLRRLVLSGHDLTLRSDDMRVDNLSMTGNDITIDGDVALSSESVYFDVGTPVGLHVDAAGDVTWSGVDGAVSHESSIEAGGAVTIDVPVFGDAWSDRYPYYIDAPPATALDIRAGGPCVLNHEIHLDYGTIDVDCSAVDVYGRLDTTGTKQFVASPQALSTTIHADGDITLHPGAEIDARVAASHSTVTLDAGGHVFATDVHLETGELYVTAGGDVALDGVVQVDTDSDTAVISVSGTSVTLTDTVSLPHSPLMEIDVTATETLTWAADVAAPVPNVGIGPAITLTGDEVVLSGDITFGGRQGFVLDVEGRVVTVPPEGRLVAQFTELFPGTWGPDVNLTATETLRVDGEVRSESLEGEDGDIVLTGCDIDVSGTVSTATSDGGAVTFAPSASLVMSGAVSASDAITISATPPVLDLSGTFTPDPVVVGSPAPLCE